MKPVKIYDEALRGIDLSFLFKENKELYSSFLDENNLQLCDPELIEKLSKIHQMSGGMSFLIMEKKRIAGEILNLLNTKL
ncbi:hypothetical protein C1631_022800 [Chryseobacterium phosphatilyticum]|uniref:Uncharacterized protein n=1 Tax=Chryseobacterium phosphatilyticum TaxID=475075 RepID=A0A316WMA5_9FLAO|nr:hypothetical protein [Chryseobacterium phosphatilyticum]PWN62397.1 hypothetical protein C1631_022800 [Chryseobacterium phosphatilyticum]